MTSKYLRNKYKIKESVFPPYPHLNRLKRVRDIREIGFFSIDRIAIVTSEFVKYEDWPGEYLGRIKLKHGLLHRFKLEDFEYQFFQGIGQNRRLMFNPRHFQGRKKLDSFVAKILQGRDYHITQVDFSYFLKKTYFSIDFLFWILWMKGGKVFGPIEYPSQMVSLINKSRYQRFDIGKSKKRNTNYDCDAHNIDKNREQCKMVNNSINMEISLRDVKTFEKYNVKTLEDLYEHFPIIEVLTGIEFVDPTIIEEDYLFHELKSNWERFGATRCMREYYSKSKIKDYKRIPQIKVQCNLKSLKNSLIELACIDFENFKKNNTRSGKNGIQRCAYLMEPMFEEFSSSEIAVE